MSQFKEKRFLQIDVTGQRFNRLFVIGFSHRDEKNRILYKCVCECDKEVFATAGELRGGTKRSCGSKNGKCGRYIRKGKEIYNYSGYEDITGARWNTIIGSARTRELAFNITKEQVWALYEIQNRRCALTGREISFKGNLRTTASVDRIDSKRGYEPDNIRIVHKDVNIMRNKFTDDDYIGACRNVARKANKAPIILGIDFDGTIVEEAFPNIGALKPNARNALIQLYEAGYYIIIWTCRSGHHLEEMHNFLDSSDIPYDAINAQHPALITYYGNDTRKLSVDFLIDDKCIIPPPDWFDIFMILETESKKLKHRALGFLENKGKRRSFLQ